MRCPGLERLELRPRTAKASKVHLQPRRTLSAPTTFLLSYARTASEILRLCKGLVTQGQGWFQARRSQPRPRWENNLTDRSMHVPPRRTCSQDIVAIRLCRGGGCAASRLSPQCAVGSVAAIEKHVFQLILGVGPGTGGYRGKKRVVISSRGSKHAWRHGDTRSGL